MVHFVCTQYGVDRVDADLIEVAVAEACNNALRHGVTREGRSSYNLVISVDDREVKAIVSGEGAAFDFNGIEPFDIHQDFMTYKNGGLGVPLIKALMDEVHYQRKNDRINELTLVKYVRRKSKGREMNP